MATYRRSEPTDATDNDTEEDLSQSCCVEDESSSEVNEVSTEAGTDDSEDGLSAIGDLTLDDEGDDGDDDFMLYDLKNESLSSQPDSSLDDAVKVARSASGEVVKGLEKLDVRDQLQGVRKKASQLARWENPARRTIGIVGDSAAGKSSLINSLLNIRNLAHKGDHGSAVTSFITEYHHRTHEHQFSFTVDATFMDEAEIEHELHELLFNFRDLYRPGLSQELEGLDQEFREIERKSELAHMTLESIFPDQPEVAQEYLLGPSVEAIEKRLRELASKLPWPEGSSQGHWTSGANTPSACHAKVAEFMNNGLWPLTYVVRIFLDAKVLETGLILADLPGLRDVNIARIRRVEQYLYHCDQVFIVANINRAVTDQSVKTQICARGSELQSKRNVCVVCTHADEIDLAASEKRWEKVAKFPATKAAKKEVAKARKENNAAAVQLADIRYQSIFAKARNSDVSDQLKTKYRNAVGEIDVFCVGNKNYEGLEFWDPDARLLAVQGSGIPELRKYCYGISERDNSREATHFINVDIPDLIQSLRVWVKAAEQETTEQAMPDDLIVGLQNTLDKAANDLANYLTDELQDHVLDHWAPRQHRFDHCATEASEDWESYHHTQYKAWVRNNGTHATRLKSARWNEEILGDMNATMPQKWDALLQDVESRLNTTLNTIGQAINYVDEQVKDVDEASPLRTILNLKKRTLSHQLRTQWMDLIQAIRTIRYNATGDHVSSYVLTTMIPTYRACARENGTGMTARMHNIMATRMAQRNIFRFIYDRIDTGCRQIFTDLETRFRSSCAGVCEELQRALETTNGGVATADFSGAQKDEVEAVRELINTVQRRLDGVGRGAEVEESRSLGSGGRSERAEQQAVMI